jgi:hypothetical protein
MRSQRLAWLLDFGPAGVLFGFGLGFVSVGCFAFPGFGRWVCFAFWFGLGLAWVLVVGSVLLLVLSWVSVVGSVVLSVWVFGGWLVPISVMIRSAHRGLLP